MAGLVVRYLHGSQTSKRTENWIICDHAWMTLTRMILISDHDLNDLDQRPRQNDLDQWPRQNDLDLEVSVVRYWPETADISGVLRVGRMGGVSALTEEGTESELSLGGVHDCDKPVPRDLQVILQVRL